MIRAQMTLKDGKTPGAMRQGAAAIEVCLANGCRIYPNPLNRIPDEYRQHVLDLDNDMGRDEAKQSMGFGNEIKGGNAVHQAEGGNGTASNPIKSKRPRIKRVKH